MYSGDLGEVTVRKPPVLSWAPLPGSLAPGLIQCRQLGSPGPLVQLGITGGWQDIRRAIRRSGDKRITIVRKSPEVTILTNVPVCGLLGPPWRQVFLRAAS